MMPESWVALGGGALLAAAAMIRGLVLLRSGPDRGRWYLPAAGLELGAFAALAVAFVLAALAHGEWSPVDLRQVTLGLALAALGIYLVLVVRPGLPRAQRIAVGGAGLTVDLIVLGLSLFGVFAIRPGGPILLCVQRTLPFYARWVLWLLGAGALIVAGSVALTLMLRLVLLRRSQGFRLLRRMDLYGLLAHTTSLALLALGGSLAVGVWWAWRTEGMLTSGDPREGWAAITWLVAAMGSCAQGLEGRARRWSAGLALVAAAGVIFGLLVVPDLYRLLGI